MDEPEPGWLDFLLTDEATQPLPGLELESASGAFDTGLGSLFEPASLQSDIPELQLDAPPALPSTHSPLHHSSGAENTVQLAHSQNTSSGGGSCSSGVEQAGGVVQGQPAVCPLPDLGAAQQRWATAGTLLTTPGSTCSQERSGTLQAAQVTIPDMADSSGQSDQQRCPADATELAGSDQKRQARLARNRENAQLSRQRKKAAVQGLEQRVTQLQVQNAQLTGLVGRLTVEVTALRCQLATVCQQAGKPVPHVPSALAPCIPALGALPTRPVATLPAGAPARLPAGQLPGAAAVAPGAVPRASAPVPLQPVQQQAAQRLACQQQQQQAGVVPPRPVQQSAAPVQPMQPFTSAPAADGGKGKKRARAAGSAFAALFMLFMFVGPIGSPGNQGALPQALPSPDFAGPGRIAALPAGSAGVLATQEHSRVGRGLLQFAELPDTRVAEVAATRLEQQMLRALPAAAGDQQHSSDGCSSSSTNSGASDCGGGNQLAMLWNSTLGMLWPSRQPLSQPELEALALQRLQELAPVALLLDADDPSGQGSSPLAASQAFPQLAGQLFASSGLRAPDVCQPVFELDASSLPPSERSRRSIERLLLGTLGMKGRSLVPAEGEKASEKRSTDAAAAAAGGMPALPGGTEGQEVEADESQEVLVVDDGWDWREEEEGFVMRQLSSSSGSKARHEPLRLESTAAATLAETGGEEGGSGAAPLLVSILLPANASNGVGQQGANVGGLLSSLGKVFVVMLYPRQRYVVSACNL